MRKFLASMITYKRAELFFNFFEVFPYSDFLIFALLGIKKNTCLFSTEAGQLRYHTERALLKKSFIDSILRHLV